MNPILINYVIRSSISLGLLYLFFVAFLGREKMHQFNRYYLLVSLVFSFVVPLLTLPSVIPSVSIINVLDVPIFQGNNLQSQSITLQKSSHIIVELILVAIYFSISTVLFIRFLFNLVRLVITKNYKASIDYEGYKVVLIDEHVLPYSFLSTIYVNSVDFKEGRIPSELLSHEISHLNQWHSLDIVFIELLKVFFWFNPLLYFFKKSIMLNHEYLADEEVTRTQNNPKSYIDSLLNIAFRNNKSYLTSSFNYSFTKKRLLMLTKNNFSRMTKLKKIAVMPLFLALGLLVINAQEIKTPKDTQKPYVIVEEMPEFPGVGDNAMRSWISKNLQYPREALKQKIEGIVTVKFYIDTNGKPQDIVVTNTDNPILNAEAKRVVGSMPDWKPGKQGGKPVDVYKTVLIVFALK